MRSTILCFLCLCFTYCCAAQKQGNVWYFGYKDGLNFNTSPPTQIVGLTGTAGGMQQGTACISDSSGKLLFYTDNVQIINRWGAQMQNGSGINGHLSSAQGSIIVPRPGSDSLFYVFTADASENYLGSASPAGYNYSIVDMCLDRRNADTTLGAVIPGKKNIHIADYGTEKLCAASDGVNGYWIVGHRMFSDSFYTWHLTSTGLSNKIAQRIGPKVGDNTGGNVWGMNGQMKFNPACTRIATVSGSTSSRIPPTIDLYDFNPLTGQLSNPCQIIVSPDSLARVYGLEFSPNGSKMYVTTRHSSGYSYVVQFTFGPTCTSTSESRDTIFKSAQPYLNMFSMQAAPDGNIYICTNYSFPSVAKLHRINNPDGARSYDSSAFTVTARSLYNIDLPAFVAGFRYHNKICKCNRPASVSNGPIVDDLQLVPNPTDGFLSISGGTGVANDLSLEITDATGRTVYRSATLPAYMDLRMQPAGLYFYRVYSHEVAVKSGKISVIH